MMYYNYPSLIEGTDPGFVRAEDGSLVSKQNEAYLEWIEEGNIAEEWNQDANQ